ncbi:Variable major protein (plasmid) [Borrelia crocidurae DOU]|uniref:Variable large protein n=1 Tax=Borrelia crocidurae DOU TaxID=1293575 RepID=W5SLB9_9SPIR|nr:Variable major protein [Borrelia crocidurae DOU]
MLGFHAVKSTDNRSEVGKHFEKTEKGLKSTKDKLDGLIKDITSTSHADTKVVEAVIKSSSEVLTELMTLVANLAGVTKANTIIGDTATDAAAVAADSNDVRAIVENVKKIIELAKNSGVKIEDGNAGNPVTGGAQTNAPAVLGGTAQANSGPKLAEEVAKADPWAMIDKIKISKTKTAGNASDNDSAGELATANAAGNNGAAAKTNADLAAAVALKAMTKSGKFSAVANEVGAVKAAATSAVNKVLGILDIIISKTVSSNLEKIREAVKGIKYSETSGVDFTKSDTTQSTTTK